MSVPEWWAVAKLNREKKEAEKDCIFSCVLLCIQISSSITTLSRNPQQSLQRETHIHQQQPERNKWLQMHDKSINEGRYKSTHLHYNAFSYCNFFSTSNYIHIHFKQMKSGHHAQPLNLSMLTRNAVLPCGNTYCTISQQPYLAQHPHPQKQPSSAWMKERLPRNLLRYIYMDIWHELFSCSELIQREKHAGLFLIQEDPKVETGDS